MGIDELMLALESSWQSAYPGHEAVARDQVLRELWRLLQQREPAPREPMRIRLRLVRC